LELELELVHWIEIEEEQEKYKMRSIGQNLSQETCDV
jgi:hypothetical protein